MIRLRPSGVDEILIKRVQDWYEPGPGVFIQSLTASFSPAMLFTGSTTGAWYDPSDTTTLFQDAAGTLPVTAVEQPVGLMLDKSKGLVLGSELVTNGDFSNGTTGWTAGNSATFSVAAGVATITNSISSVGRIDQSFSTVVGNTYKVTATFFNPLGGSPGGQLYIGTSTGTFNVAFTTAATGSVTLYFRATTATTYLSAVTGIATTGASIQADNISVRELPGNHAFNSSGNSANFPVLSARYNLLTKTEQFDDAVWTKVNSSIVANTTATTDPLGGNTADKLVESTANNNHTVYVFNTTLGTLTWSIYAKAAERTWLTLTTYSAGTSLQSYFNLSNGTIGSVSSGHTAEITSISNGWYRCSIKVSYSTNISNSFYAQPAISDNTGSYTGDGTSGIYIWGADLRVVNDALNQPAYQRVNTSSDYDTVGFKPYLRFNGTNQWLQTNSIDFTYGDKMFVSTGVRKLSDAAVGIAAELSASVFTNNGSLSVISSFNGSSAANAYSADFKGSTGVINISALNITAPNTSVLSIQGNISGDQAILRVNGTQAAISTADQGTGNYGNYPLYIGARAGSSLWANIRFYGAVVAGKQASAAEITNTETFINQKTGAY